ncbi:MAG TPA: hypothetical protein VGM39_22870 [Kofleriaceae bacterium]|jgi:cytochrome b subunit of formate dehydrogenase
MADTLLRDVVEQTARRERQRHWRASCAMLSIVAVGIPIGIGQAQAHASTNTAGALVAVLMLFSATVLWMRAMRRMKQRAAERILVAVRTREDVYWTYESGEMVGHDARGPRVRLSLTARLVMAELPVASARIRRARDLQQA